MASARVSNASYPVTSSPRTSSCYPLLHPSRRNSSHNSLTDNNNQDFWGIISSDLHATLNPANSENSPRVEIPPGIVYSSLSPKDKFLLKVKLKVDQYKSKLTNDTLIGGFCSIIKEYLNKDFINPTFLDELYYNIFPPSFWISNHLHFLYEKLKPEEFKEFLTKMCQCEEQKQFPFQASFFCNLPSEFYPYISDAVCEFLVGEELAKFLESVYKTLKTNDFAKLFISLAAKFSQNKIDKKKKANFQIILHFLKKLDEGSVKDNRQLKTLLKVIGEFKITDLKFEDTTHESNLKMLQAYLKIRYHNGKIFYFNEKDNYDQHVCRFNLFLNTLIESVAPQAQTTPLDFSLMKGTLSLLLDSDLHQKSEINGFYEHILKFDTAPVLPVIQKVLLDNLYEGKNKAEEKKCDNKVQAIYTLIQATKENCELHIGQQYRASFAGKFLHKTLIDNNIRRFYQEEKDKNDKLTGEIRRKEVSELKKSFYTGSKKLHSLMKAKKQVGLDSGERLFSTPWDNEDKKGCGILGVTFYNALTDLSSYSNAVALTAGTAPKTEANLGVQAAFVAASFLCAGPAYGAWREFAKQPARAVQLDLQAENLMLKKSLKYMDDETRQQLFSGDPAVLNNTRKCLEQSGGIEGNEGLGVPRKLQENIEREFIAHIDAKKQMKNFLTDPADFAKFNFKSISSAEVENFLGHNKLSSAEINTLNESPYFRNLFRKLISLQQDFVGTTVGEERAEAEENYNRAINFMVFKVTQHGKKAKQNASDALPGVENHHVSRGTFFQHLTQWLEVNDKDNYDKNVKLLTKIWSIKTPKRVDVDSDPQFKDDPLVKNIGYLRDLKGAQTYSAAYKIFDEIINSITVDRIHSAQVLHILDLGISSNEILTAQQKQYFFEQLEHYLQLGSTSINPFAKGGKAEGPLASLFVKRSQWRGETLMATLFYQSYVIKKYVPVAEHATNGLNLADSIASSTGGWVGAAWLWTFVDRFTTGSTSASHSFAALAQQRQRQFSELAAKEQENNSQITSVHNMKKFVNYIFNAATKKDLKLEDKFFGEFTIKQMLDAFRVDSNTLPAEKIPGALPAFLQGFHGQSRPLIMELADKLTPEDEDDLLANYYYSHKDTQKLLKNHYEKKYSNIAENKGTTLFEKLPEHKKFAKFLALETNKGRISQEEAVFICLRAKAYLLSFEKEIEKLDSKSKEYKKAQDSLELCKKELTKLLESAEDQNSPMRNLRRQSLNKAFLYKLAFRGAGAAQWGAASGFFVTMAASKILFGVAIGAASTVWGLPLAAALLLISCGIRIWVYYKSERLNHSKSSKANEFCIDHLSRKTLKEGKPSLDKSFLIEKPNLSFQVKMKFWYLGLEDSTKAARNALADLNKKQLAYANLQTGINDLVNTLTLPTHLATSVKPAGLKVPPTPPTPVRLLPARPFQPVVCADQMYIDLINETEKAEEYVQERMLKTILEDILGTQQDKDIIKQKESVLINIVRIVNIAWQSKINDYIKLKFIFSLLDEITSIKSENGLSGESVFEGLQLQAHFGEVKTSLKSFAGGTLAGLGSIASVLVSALSPFGPLDPVSLLIDATIVVASTAGDVAASYGNSGHRDVIKARKKSYHEIIKLLQDVAVAMINQNEAALANNPVLLQKVKEQAETHGITERARLLRNSVYHHPKHVEFPLISRLSIRSFTLSGEQIDFAQKREESFNQTRAAVT